MRCTAVTRTLVASGVFYDTVCVSVFLALAGYDEEYLFEAGRFPHGIEPARRWF